MVAITLLLDFLVPSEDVVNMQKRANLKANIINALKKYFNDLKPMPELNVGGDMFFMLLGPHNSLFTVRGYTEGIVTINLELFVPNSEDDPMATPKYLFNTDSTNTWYKLPFEADIAEALKCQLTQGICSMKRGLPYQRYHSTSDERLIEYDIDKLVYEERSDYQKIQIYHSKTLGNILILDEQQNLSESDLIYTETLMQRGKECYKDKEIIILGGGDGALLWELLKENPKQVTMLEIDEMVMNACSQYMRSACGDCLEKKKGINYEIIVGDCMNNVREMIKKGQKVDYVFGDLTDIPINPGTDSDEWDNITEIMNTSMKILKPTGKYITHATGVGCPEALEHFEKMFSQLDVPVKFTKDKAFVPSFYEHWVFYQLSFK